MPPAGESQSAEALTVFWTTTILATTAAALGGLVCRGLLLVSDWPTWEMLSILLLVIGSVTGLVGLVLTPLVVRQRKVPPPIALVRFAWFICLLPMVLLLLQAMS